MKHWVFPSHHNNHKAKLLKPAGFTLLFSFYLLTQLSLRLVNKVYPGVLGYSSEITTEKVFQQTNLERQKNNQPKLVYNELLSKSAESKARDMFSKGYWAHNAPDGTTPWEFFRQVDYKYSFAGENLAKDFYDTDGLLKAWMNSPTHKANIVSDKYQEIGIGVVNGTLNGYKTTLVVQHFGSPATGIIAGTKEPPELVPTVGVAKNQENTINPKTVSKTLISLIFMILVGVLAIDAYVVLRDKTHRLSGSSLAHIAFITVAFIMLLLSQQGSLL